MQLLKYDRTKWDIYYPELKRTAQIFITNRCDRNCNGCFFKSYFNKDDIDFATYQDVIKKYKKQDVTKITLLGGEPSLHPDILNMIKYNQDNGLATTIYTNGRDTEMFNGINLTGVTIRVGVLGLERSEKPLSKIDVPDYPLFIVYMMRNDNIDEILPTMYYAEEKFSCRDFMFSSIRDIEVSGDFWIDTEETTPMPEYKNVVENSIMNYDGNIPKIHVSARGIISTINQPHVCRFLNMFTDGRKIKCPLDICKHKYTEDDFDVEQYCDKKGCVLTKVVLERKRHRTNT